MSQETQKADRLTAERIAGLRSCITEAPQQPYSAVCVTALLDEIDWLRTKQIPESMTADRLDEIATVYEHSHMEVTTLQLREWAAALRTQEPKTQPESRHSPSTGQDVAEQKKEGPK